MPVSMASHTNDTREQSERVKKIKEELGRACARDIERNKRRIHRMRRGHDVQSAEGGEVEKGGIIVG